MPAFYFIAANGCQNVQNKIQYRFGQIYAHALLNSDVVQPLAFLYLLNAYSAMVYLFLFLSAAAIYFIIATTWIFLIGNFSFNIIAIIFLLRNKIRSLDIFLDFFWNI